MLVPTLDCRLPDGVLAEQLRAACEAVGFFCLEHTELEELQEAALAHARSLFALPQHEKTQLRATVATNNRGWTELGEETLDPSRQARGDTKARAHATHTQHT